MHFTATHVGSWSKLFGGFGDANGATIDDGGGVLGYGTPLTHHLTVGAAFSGAADRTVIPTQRVNTQNYGFYGYGIDTHGALRVSGSVGVGYLALSEQRTLTPTPLVANGTSQGWFMAAGTQAQYLIPLGSVFVMPYGKASYIHTGVQGYSEQGAGSLNLTYGGQRSNLGIFTAGVRSGIDLPTATVTYIPWAQIGGTGYAGNRNLSTTETVGLSSATALSEIAPASSLDVGVGLTLKGRGPWTAKVAYSGQFAHGFQINTFDVMAHYRF